MDHRAEAWYRRRTSDRRDWPLGQLLENKQRDGIRVSVLIPARNEERTVAGRVPTDERPPASTVRASARPELLPAE